MIDWLLSVLEHRLSTMDLASTSGDKLHRLYLGFERWTRLIDRERQLRKQGDLL